MAAAAAADNGQTVFITGASRGIGLGLAETYAKKGYRVIAAARNPAKADKLQALLKTYKSVQTVTLDVADSKSVAGLAAQLNALQPAVTALDLVYNNAGIFTAGVMTPLEASTVDDWLNVYRTNVVGTWEVTQKLLPFVRKSKAAKIVNLSSSLGSVSETNAGPIPGFAASYRSSKAALNQLSAVQAREYNLATVTAKPEAKAQAAPLITVIALNPGWVDTDMGNGGGTLKPPLTLEQSVTGIEKAISAAPVSAIASYLDYEGKKVEW